MSYSVDVNILLYASDAASPFGPRAKAFLADCVAGGDLFCLAWPTVVSYLRLSTHPSIFRSPLSPDDAVANVDGLLALPHVRALGEDEGFWEVYRSVTRGLAVRANLVSDAHLAAILRQHGVRTLYTNDVDFRRFSFLDVRNPLESGH